MIMRGTVASVVDVEMVELVVLVVLALLAVLGMQWMCRRYHRARRSLRLEPRLSMPLCVPIAQRAARALSCVALCRATPQTLSLHKKTGGGACARRTGFNPQSLHRLCHRHHWFNGARADFQIPR